MVFYVRFVCEREFDGALRKMREREREFDGVLRKMCVRERV